MDGSLLTAQGTEEARDTVQVRSASDEGDGGEVLAETTDCFGVHGEAAAAPNENGDVVVLGCEDGPVVYRDGGFHKVEAEFERPTQVALINSLTDELQAVELGSSYWFRSLVRGPEGEALVLTYDGELTVIDEETDELTAEIPAIEPWEENGEWQQPGPILKTAGSMAYVTEAANQQLVVIDLESGEVVNEFDLDVTPVEMAVVDGHPGATEHDGSESAGNSDAGHDHEGEDHGH